MEGAVARQPAVKATYGRKSGAVHAPAPPPGAALRSEDDSDEAGLQGETSFISDLTSLSQLTAAAGVASSQPAPFTAASQSSDDEDVPGDEQAAMPGRKSIKETLAEVDAMCDDGFPPSKLVKAFLPDQQQRPSSPASSTRKDTSFERDDSPTSSPPRKASTPPTEAADAVDDLLEDDTERVKATTRSKIIKRKAIIDSDAESDNDNAAQDEQAPTQRDDADSDASEDALPSLKAAGKKPLFKPAQSASDSDSDSARSPELEDIEQYAGSQKIKQEGASRKADNKAKKPTKAEKDKMHRESAAILRKQTFHIPSGSRPPRPISDILKRINPTQSQGRSASLAPDEKSRRHSSVAPKSKEPLHLATPLPTLFVPPNLTNPIVIGSSSAILDGPADEDSYDAKFLESQSQTLASLPRVAAKQDDSDDDEDLPDMHEQFKRDRVARELEQKKSALLMLQKAREDAKNSSADVFSETQPVGKGKARAMPDAIDLDSSDSELEVVVPKAPSPKIEYVRQDRRLESARKKIERLVSLPEKQHGVEATTDSQFHKAGRTHGFGATKTVVDEHVSSKVVRKSKAQAAFNAPSGVSKKAQDNLLMQKAQLQARQDKLSRMEAWRQLGGGFRSDVELTKKLTETGLDGEDVTQQEAQAKELMENMRVDAERAEKAADEDAEDDDYIASDEGGDEDERGSEDEHYGSADEMALVRDDEAGSGSEDNDDEEDEAETTERSPATAATVLVQSDSAALPAGAAGPDVEEDAVFLKPKKSGNVRPGVVDDDDDTSSRSDDQRNDQTAFPTFDSQKMAKVSLTQAFAGRDAPPASRAIVDGDGFSQMFQEGDFAESQMPPTPSQLSVPKKLPNLFNPVQDTPILRRHVIGEAPIALNAAARDAEIREEAEEAASVTDAPFIDDRDRAIRLTRTPGSVVSEDLPPIPNMTGLVSIFRTPADDTDADMRSLPDSEQTRAAESQHSSSAQRRRLVRAGDDDEQSSAESDSEQSEQRPNAFDVLRKGQQTLHTKASKERKRKMPNEYLAEQADESEDEGVFAAMRQDGSEDEAEGSDLDKDVEGLVENNEVDAEEQEKQDQLAAEKFKEHLAKDDERTSKRVQNIVAGKERKKKQDDLLDFSDYEDDDADFIRKAKRKKQIKFGSKIEAIANNERTKCFGDVLMNKNAREENQLLRDTQYLQDEASSEADADAGEDEFMDEEANYRSRGRTRLRQATPDLALIDRAIWGGSSSPILQVKVTEQTTAIHASNGQLVGKRAYDDFADLDEHYTATSSHLHTRKILALEDDSQNDRGIGPGRSSAVTSFVKRKASTTTNVVISRQTSRASVIPQTASGIARSASSASASNLGKGRLAMARQIRKVTA